METQNSLFEGCHFFHRSLTSEESNKVVFLRVPEVQEEEEQREERRQHLHKMLSFLIAIFVSQLLIELMLEIPTQLKNLLEKLAPNKLLLKFLICCPAAEESSVLPDFSFSVSQ